MKPRSTLTVGTLLLTLCCAVGCGGGQTVALVYTPEPAASDDAITNGTVSVSVEVDTCISQ